MDKKLGSRKNFRTIWCSNTFGRIFFVLGESLEIHCSRRDFGNRFVFVWNKLYKYCYTEKETNFYFLYHEMMHPSGCSSFGIWTVTKLKCKIKRACFLVEKKITVLLNSKYAHLFGRCYYLTSECHYCSSRALWVSGCTIQLPKLLFLRVVAVPRLTHTANTYSGKTVEVQ